MSYSHTVVDPATVGIPAPPAGDVVLQTWGPAECMAGQERSISYSAYTRSVVDGVARFSVVARKWQNEDWKECAPHMIPDRANGTTDALRTAFRAAE